MILEMELERPFRSITPTVDGDVLYILARAETSFTPPQVHHLVGQQSVDGVRRVLVRLTEQGIVRGERVGHAVEYSLNRDHLAADAVVAIARLRETFIARLRTLLGEWPVPPLYAALFGSAARGTMSSASDVDIFVVRGRATDANDDQWNDQVHHLERVVRDWTGNEADVLVYDEADLSIATHDDVVDEVVRDGIELVGSLSDLRRRVTRR